VESCAGTLPTASAKAAAMTTANQVRLQLFVLAYNPGNYLRQAVLPWRCVTGR
jgi:hypothetical protein